MSVDYLYETVLLASSHRERAAGRSQEMSRSRQYLVLATSLTPPPSSSSSEGRRRFGRIETRLGNGRSRAVKYTVVPVSSDRPA